MGNTGYALVLNLSLKKHPHGRGEDRGRMHAVQVHGGNTPTGVGKTGEVSDQSADAQKHPHRRGEDGRIGGHHGTGSETPPQAWGRLRGIFTPGGIMGNTPTGVGKT